MKTRSILITMIVFIVSFVVLGCRSFATTTVVEESPTEMTEVKDTAESEKEAIKETIKKIAQEKREGQNRNDALKPTKGTSSEQESVVIEAPTEISETTVPQPTVTPELIPPPQEIPTQQTETSEVGFPMGYGDSTVSITIDRTWTGYAYVYSAHVVLSDYKRAGMYCANNTWGEYCTTSEAASQLGAILCINGDYNPPDIAYKCARQGVCYNDGPCYAEGIYNNNNGMLFYGGEKSPTAGQALSTLIANGIATDTMQFGPAFLRDGQLYISEGGNRRPRTFIGTNGKPGDLFICVADGDLNDGESYGLTGYECAEFLRSHGCIFGVPLDGGGSSTMVFQGTVINAVAGKERAVTDFFFIR